MKDLNQMSASELCSRLLIMWGLNEMTPGSQKYITNNEDEFISKIIFKRTEAYDIKIPLELGYIIAMCSGGNPGKAIIIYYNILDTIFKNRGAIPYGYEITPSDFSLAYPMSFPLSIIPEEDKKLEEMWDGQKDERGDNMVDKISYWDKLFKEED